KQENIIALLAAGADVMARDEDGDTPLHIAVIEGNQEYMEVLLASGADVMAQNENGNTPLHLAAWRDRPENIQALLAAGADATVKNNYGETPLDYALEKDDLIDTDAFKALKTATCGEGNWFKNIIGWCGWPKLGLN
ncbi:MAG: ankyrin repeat domain-containing protein, partial [Paracoccaceae bacterium]|nr:ankyrin repeat domain-containing protein [Paracoccaceae bacterium]